MNFEHLYDEVTARHYAAYRPPLHQTILDKGISSDVMYSLGLDVGCGTGQSTIALANYCEAVIGIEPSSEMLEQAIQHPKITYRYYDGKTLNFPEHYFDIITFAGSLFYAKSQELLNELIRVSKVDSLIILYDFELLLGDLYTEFNLNTGLEKSAYNHEEDFTGLNELGLQKEAQSNGVTHINMESKHLAHILLSMKAIYQVFQERYQLNDPYGSLTKELQQLSKQPFHRIKTKIYYTIYRCNKLLTNKLI